MDLCFTPAQAEYVSKLKAKLAESQRGHAEAIEEWMRLEAENKRLTEALEFYADPNSHAATTDEWGDIVSAPVDTDDGDIARRALQE